MPRRSCCCRCADPIVELNYDGTACVQEATPLGPTTNALATPVPIGSTSGITINSVSVNHLGSYSTVIFDVTVTASGHAWVWIPTGGSVSYTTMRNAAAWHWDNARAVFNFRTTFEDQATAQVSGFHMPGTAGAPSLAVGLILKHSSGAWSFSHNDGGIHAVAGDCWAQTAEIINLFFPSQMESTIQIISGGGDADSYPAGSRPGQPAGTGTIEAGLGFRLIGGTAGNYKIAIDIADLTVNRVRSTWGSTYAWLDPGTVFTVDVGGTAITLNHTYTPPAAATIYSGTNSSPTGWTSPTQNAQRPDLSGYSQSPAQPYGHAWWGEANLPGGGVVGALIQRDTSLYGFQPPGFDAPMDLIIYGAGPFTFSEDWYRCINDLGPLDPLGNVIGGDGFTVYARDATSDQDIIGYQWVMQHQWTGKLGYIALSGPPNKFFTPNPLLVQYNDGGGNFQMHNAWLRNLNTVTCDWGGDAYSGSTYDHTADEDSDSADFGPPTNIEGGTWQAPFVANVGNAPQSWPNIATGWGFVGADNCGHVPLVRVSVTP